MASTNYTNYTNLCRETRLQLTTGFKRAKSKEEFATRAMVKGVMSPDKLQRVYDSLRAENALPTINNSHISAQEFITLIQDKNLRHFLAVLMCAKCSIDAAKAFVETLVLGAESQEAREWPKENPCLLPATEEYLNNLFNDPNDANDFFKEQRPFCTIIIGGPTMVTIHNEDQRALPWLSEENIGEGSFGIVFKVHVAEGHLTKDRDFNQTNEDPEVIARKDFITETVEENAEASFQKEWEAIRKIFNSTQTHGNIVKSFGRIKIEGQPSTFSLLMPLADMDLDKYMQIYRDPIVNDNVARQILIKAVMGLSDGLDFLHSGLRKEDGGENLICYHMDLKPSNILVFNVGRPDMSWKLSDFGLSRVKPKSRADVSDLSRIFRKRGSDQHSKATATINLRGEGTYQPREAQDKGKTMNEKSDVWSLGCIISLLFTFMEEGLRGIQPFSDSRKRHSGSVFDVFYQHNRTIFTYSINKGVTKQHDKLIEAAKERYVTEGKILSFILKWLEREVLVIDQDERCAAADIFQRLKMTLERYKDMGVDPSPRTSSRSPTFFKKAKSMTRSTWSGLRGSSGVNHRKTSATQTDMSQWRLGIEKGMRFRGSDSSPNGEFLVYWNDQTMKLFSDTAVINPVSSFHSGHASTYSESSRSREQVLTSPGQHVLQNTRQSWRSGALTDRYLIAAATDGTDTFKCYIFDIEANPRLGTYSQITLADTGQGIHKLIAPPAGPPGKPSFACILNDDNNGRCSILIARIDPDTSTQPNGQPGEEALSSCSIQLTHLPVPSQNLPRHDAGIRLLRQIICPFQWRAIEIEHVALQTRDEVYVVIRGTSDLSLHLFTIDPPGVLQRDLNLNASGENGERLFTDMICFSNADDSRKTDVIVVAQRESIFHFIFHGVGNDPKVVRHLPVKDYWILKIARDEPGSILALGTHSGNNNVFLLSIKLKGKIIRPDPKVLAELHGVSSTHQPKLSLLRGANGSIAQVTAATPDGQYRVYRLDLTGVLDT
ncbi:unnamed protein product [Fusarium graminearum]|uniref:non-specific serine/threonine protein kinase n=1 Tax=Gibberella zeae TaxID=5518 RepID=A0A9N8NKY7_GIBZA|nr:hypothetical protein FG05_09150 [Fusarium graminearum]CAF3475206.1 unnamed protein product [Fusarium graminearum]CAG1971667.1 unnamed protein product [Fusarium graminearum]CAG1988007.1 unnamed protein product [Fusarium graminearum]